MMAIARILVPIDFSPPSLRALDDTVEFSQPYQAQLIVMHVVERASFDRGARAAIMPRRSVGCKVRFTNPSFTRRSTRQAASPRLSCARLT
jgi:nucleotide-binding universal stress UspA family protein